MPFDQRRAAVVTAGFAAFLNLYPPQALLPQLEQAFAVGSGGATVTVAAGPLSVALLAPFAGIVTDIVGRARMMAIAMIGLGLATILSGTANSLGEMLFWRLACGLFVPGIVAAAAGSLGDDPDPQHAARAAGQYIAGTVLGGFSGRFLAGIVTEYLGWRAAFYVIGGLTLALLPLVIPGMRLAARPTCRRGRVTPCTLRLLTCATAPAGCVRDRVRVALARRDVHLRGPAPRRTALLTFACGHRLHLRGVPGRSGAHAVHGALGRRPRPQQSGHGRNGFAMLGILLTLLGGAPVIITGLAVSCGGIFMLQALATGFVPTAATQAKSAAVGLYTSAYYFGGSVGAIAPSLVWQRFGWPGCVGLILIAHLALLLVARRLWGPRQPPE